MPSAILIHERNLGAVADAVFEDEAAAVYSSYSPLGEALYRFGSAREMKTHIDRCLGERTFGYGFAVWYPSMGGRVVHERIALNPKSCDGHTFRYVAGGWGVIHLQLDFDKRPLVGCTVSVNSEKRALAWQPLGKEYDLVSEWNWAVVAKHARRLSRRAKAVAQLIAASDAPQVARA